MQDLQMIERKEVEVPDEAGGKPFASFRFKSTGIGVRLSFDRDVELEHVQYSIDLVRGYEDVRLEAEETLLMFVRDRDGRPRLIDAGFDFAVAVKSIDAEKKVRARAELLGHEGFDLARQGLKEQARKLDVRRERILREIQYLEQDLMRAAEGEVEP